MIVKLGNPFQTVSTERVNRLGPQQGPGLMVGFNRGEKWPISE